MDNFENVTKDEVLEYLCRKHKNFRQQEIFLKCGTFFVTGSCFVTEAKSIVSFLNNASLNEVFGESSIALFMSVVASVVVYEWRDKRRNITKIENQMELIDKGETTIIFFNNWFINTKIQSINKLISSI